eukprot:8028908-Alexandrium_andersonii.AAC.1
MGDLHGRVGDVLPRRPACASPRAIPEVPSLPSLSGARLQLSLQLVLEVLLAQELPSMNSFGQ